jgi:hypothetical protein
LENPQHPYLFDTRQQMCLRPCQIALPFITT